MGVAPSSQAQILSTLPSVSGTQRACISVPPFLESESLSGLPMSLPRDPPISASCLHDPHAVGSESVSPEFAVGLRRLSLTAGPGASPSLGSRCTRLPSPLRTGMCVIRRWGWAVEAQGAGKSREGCEQPLRPVSLHISKHRWERRSHAGLWVTHV